MTPILFSKVESLLETFGMSPGDIGDIHGPWRHWRRLATFVCDIHLLATLATFVGDIQQRMSPGHSLRETNAKNVGALTSFSEWRATARMSPGDIRLNVSSPNLATFGSGRMSPGDIQCRMSLWQHSAVAFAHCFCVPRRRCCVAWP